jgi:hypothetical protein
MIGKATKNVVAFQNFSSACGFCDRHLKAEAKKAEDDQATNDTTNNIPMPPPTTSVPKHYCPNNYSGSSKEQAIHQRLDATDAELKELQIASRQLTTVSLLGANPFHRLRFQKASRPLASVPFGIAHPLQRL